MIWNSSPLNRKLSIYWMGEEHGINNVYSKNYLSDRLLLIKSKMISRYATKNHYCQDIVKSFK